MYQPTTNFIGRDPMQWWIGQVTDPDKGEWGDSLEKKQAEDGIRDAQESRGLGDVYKRQPP